MSHGVIPAGAASAARGGLVPLARRLRAMGVTANAVTIVGLLIVLAGAALLAAGALVPALVLLVVGSLFDTLDGALARVSGGGTRLGAFVDSTADRLSDAALFSATVVLGVARSDQALIWPALIALSSSLLVSYVHAKAEALGSSARIGPAPREARLVIALAGLAGWVLLSNPTLFVAAIAVVAVLSTYTLAQRVAFVTMTLRNTKGQ